MAPLSSGLADAIWEVDLISRGLGGSGGNDTSIEASLSPGQKNTLHILALSFSTLSVASSVLTFYWFCKMRRSFRHE